MHLRKIQLGILAFFSVTGEARDLCDYYKDYIPEVYNAYCTGGRSHTQMSGASASFADAFNLNPASIPTFKTPFGIEVIASSTAAGYSAPTYNFAVIRGFQKFGAAISTNNDTSVYSTKTSTSGNSQVVPSGIAIPTINAGFASNLLKDEQKVFLTPNFGVSGRYNRNDRTFGYGMGLNFTSTHFSIGASYAQDGLNIYTSSARNFYTAMLSIRLNAFQADYNFVKNSGSNTGGTSTAPIHIASASLMIGPVQASGAFRQYSDDTGAAQNVIHFAIELRATKFLALAYLYNYIPGTQSLGAQLMLF